MALQDDLKQALDTADEIELTVTGRVSGGPRSRPVWFVHDSSHIYLLPMRGTLSEWFKNLLANPMVRLRAGGQEITAQAQPITEPARVQAVVEKFRHKYGAADVKRSYTGLNAAVEVPLD